jgi:hypothetical protein
MSENLGKLSEGLDFPSCHSKDDGKEIGRVGKGYGLIRAVLVERLLEHGFRFAD